MGGLGLEEALSIPDLTAATHALKEVVNYLRETPRERLRLQSNLRRVESEKQRLTKEIQDTEKKYDDIINKLRDDNNILKSQLADQTRNESFNQMNHKQILILEKALNQEKLEKNKIIEKLNHAREENERINKNLLVVSHDITHTRDEHLLIQGKSQNNMEQYNHDITELNKELKAVSHHRNVLRDTIEQLEKQIKLKYDQLAEVTSQNEMLTNRIQQNEHRHNNNNSSNSLNNSNHNNTSRGSLFGSSGTMNDNDEECDVLRRQSNRFRIRSFAMEELVTIYRMGIMALYPNGATYSSAQYSLIQDSHNSYDNNNDNDIIIGNMNQNNNGGWIEKELNNIKKSYDEEIKVLDLEVTELRSKLRQSNSYISELRKRFEENIKTLYRYDCL